MGLFLILGFVGLGLLVISLIIGEIADGVLDVFDAGDWLSASGLAAFLGAFGFTGALIESTTGSWLIALAVATVFGLLLAWLATRLTRWLRKSETETTGFETKLLGGYTATVINDIPTEGMGEIMVPGQGKLYAASDIEIVAGEKVIIVNDLSPTSVFVVPEYRR